MTERQQSFGASVPRIEDAALLNGRGQFIDDIVLPGTLSAVFVRSPIPHALIKTIDSKAAKALPGVHAIYTHADLRGHLTADRTPLGQSVRELVGLASRSLRQDITPFVLTRDEAC